MSDHVETPWYAEPDPESVKACNAHDKLARACEAMVSSLKGWHINSCAPRMGEEALKDVNGGES